MEVRLGTFPLTFPGPYLQQLQHCNHLLESQIGLRNEIKTKGYVYLKDFHPRQEVLSAKNVVLNYINEQGKDILNTDTHTVGEGVLNPRCGLGCLPFMEGKNRITHSNQMKKVIEGDHVFRFFEKYFGEKAITFDFKWLRAMHSDGYTGAHVDRVYMSRGSQDLLTMWTPLGDIPANMGVLAVCEGSNHDACFGKLQTTYGNCDLEAEGVTGSGWFTEDPHEITKIGGTWKTSNFQAGDVIIFDMRLVHMSTTNLTKFVRLSCDTRWQPASHKADERFVGEKVGVEQPKFGVHGACGGRTKTIENLKPSWGFASSI